MIPVPEKQWHRLLRRNPRPAASFRRAYLCITCMMLFLFYTIACSNNEQQAKKENIIVDDSLQTVNSIVSEDSAMIFTNKANNWIGDSVMQTGLNWNRFHLTEFWSEDSLQEKSFELPEGFYKDYAQVLRWSPDSTYVLDLGSYGSVKVKDKTGNTRIESGEPDTEVSMLYPKTKSMTRLLFFGPGTVIIDGRWLNSSQVAVLGLYDEKDNHHPDTLLWIINAKDKFFRKYKWE